MRAFTAKHPHTTEYFNSQADCMVWKQNYFSRHNNLGELALYLGDLRAVMNSKTFLPGLRDRYPFHTCVIEHAEELVPSLVTSMKPQ